MTAIQSYQILKMGSGYTFKSLEEMEYYDFIIINTCISSENKAQERAMSTGGGVHAEAVRYEESANFQWK